MIEWPFKAGKYRITCWGIDYIVDIAAVSNHSGCTFSGSYVATSTQYNSGNVWGAFPLGRITKMEKIA